MVSLCCCLGRSGVAWIEFTFLWDLPMWIFKPFSEFKLLSHWSHLNAFLSLVSASFSGVASVVEDFLSGEGQRFLSKNSALLLAFLLKVDGLFLFFDKGVEPSPLVSKENEKEEPTLHYGASNEIKEIEVCKKCPKVKPYCVPIFDPIMAKPF